jgi:nucleoside-diphosphate-sugar epimerase
MQFFVVGASGYVGSAVAAALQNRGHGVLAAARTGDTARKLSGAGIDSVTADIVNPESLQAPAQRADGVVYAVQYNGEDPLRIEGAALRALVDALAGSGKPLLYTSGVWIYGDTGGRAVDEDAPIHPTPLVAHRPQLERFVLDGVERGVAAIVIRPGIVYGSGGGIPAMWLQSARDEGAARFVGDGTNHWPTIHREDLAELYALALDRPEPGAIYNAADDSAFTVAEMAAAASRGAGRDGATAMWPLDEARKTLGAFADALALDALVDSSRARERFGWHARRPAIVDDLRAGTHASS